MKKAPLFTALMIVAFALSACAGTSTSTNSFRSNSGASGALNPQSKLALGTIKLEGTKQAVDGPAAAKLIPLWQLMVQLDSSSSSAPQEVTAVMDQIKTAMTSEQLNTINGMSLTQADIFTVFQQQAQGNGAGGAGGSGTTPGFTGRNRGNSGGGGFAFGGGGPGGGPGGFDGGFGGGNFRNNAGNGASAGTQLDSAQAAQARENATSSLLINQLIRLLETKLSSQPG